MDGRITTVQRFNCLIPRFIEHLIALFIHTIQFYSTKKIALMKRKFFTALTCMSSIATVSVAQNNSIQLGFGLQRTWLLDQQGSPLKYQTKEKIVSFGYKHFDENSELDIKLIGALGDFFPTGFLNRQLYNPGYNADGTHKTDSSLMNGKIYSGRIKLGYARAVSSGYSVIDK